MKFYGRKAELSIIQEELELVNKEHSSRMIVVTCHRSAQNWKDPLN